MLLLLLAGLRGGVLRAQASAAQPGTVVISEVAWAGTAASSADEWVELFNPTGQTIDLSNWTLSDGGDLFEVLSGQIPPGGFFLLERTDDNPVADVPGDLFFTGSLSNSGQTLTLRAVDGTIIDTANGDGGPWPAGSAGPTFATMERLDPNLPDSDANWVSNDGATRNGVDAKGAPLNGTPKARNSAWPPPKVPDLAVQLFGPPAVRPGGAGAFPLVVSNMGQGVAAPAYVTVTLPADLAYAGAGSAVPPVQAGLSVAWQFPDIPAGRSLTFPLTVTVGGAALEGPRSLHLDASTPGESAPADNQTALTVTVHGDLPARLLINEILADPGGDANGDGVQDQEDDEFVELLNNTGVDVDLSGWLLVEANGLRHLFPGGTLLPAGCSLVIFGGGAPVGAFAGALVQTSSTGGLSLNNGGDELALLDAQATVVDAVSYGSEANKDQSITRTPDGAGAAPVTPHSQAPDAGGRIHSPGRQVNGRPFPGCTQSTPELAQQAPAWTTPGSTFTYTLTLDNDEVYALHNVVVEDRLPASVTVAAALDGGQVVSDVVRWAAPVLAAGEALTVRVAVTAPVAAGVVFNTALTATASNLGDVRTGSPARTLVDDSVRISAIQGAGHRSPLEGQHVTGVPGIVTAIVTRGGDLGFFMQDPNPDGDPATSEGIFVRTDGDPGVSVGDAVIVSGVVAEALEDPDSLTVTELHTVTVQTVSALNPLPSAVVLGEGGRTPPDAIIDDDGLRRFDPDQDGVDFYESLEGMRVRLHEPLTVGPTTGGLLPVVADRGAGASVLSPEKTLVIRDGDFNPERVLLGNRFVSLPDVSGGVVLSGTVEGVLGYRAANYQLWPTALLPEAPAAEEPTPLSAPLANQLSVATLNGENLDPTDPQAKFDSLARQIVSGLQAPDLIGLVEVQDSNGPVDDGVVDATDTYNRLVLAIIAAGGPFYRVRQIDPEDDQDGGEPGGNIRVAFLFRTDRGLSFVERPGGDATTPVEVMQTVDGVQLSLSPGRVAPGDSAFQRSRKPLAGEFRWQGHPLFVVLAHLTAKGADDPLFGARQPPVFSSAAKRGQQARILNGFVQQILAQDANAYVLVLGDLNDTPDSGPLRLLAGTQLTDLWNEAPANRRYSFIFQGNSQALDHILASRGLLQDVAVTLQAYHANSRFPNAASDHDPVLARFSFRTERVYLPVVVRE